jgi:hypothetical protein
MRNYCVIEFSSMGPEMRIFVDFKSVGCMIDDIDLWPNHKNLKAREMSLNHHISTPVFDSLTSGNTYGID